MQRRSSGHVRPWPVAVVAAGGFIGTFLRYSLAEAAGTQTSWPLATLAVNTSGAFLLGFLMGAVRGLGPETPRRRSIRLFLGPGLLGSFTTYSGFAVELMSLRLDGDGKAALAYAGASLAVGLAAAAAGLLAGGSVRRRGHGKPGAT